MTFLTKEPFMLRRAGWMFALAPPAALYLAYDVREDEPVLAGLTVIIALVSVAISMWSFRRAASAEGKRRDS